MEAATRLNRPAPYISDPKPYDRIGEARQVDGRDVVPIAAEPIFFDLTPPSRFDEATVRVVFDPGQSALEVGGLVSGPDNIFEMRPLYHPLFDGLDWKMAASGRLTLFDRNGEYASVEEFLSHPPEASRVAVWGTGPDFGGGVDGYRPSSGPIDIQVSLRGHHRILAYTGGEQLDFSFTVQDMNRSVGADPVVVTVFEMGGTEPLAQSELDDDGDGDDDQRSSKLRTVSVSLAGLAVGAYQVDFAATSDVFVRKISTRQSKFVFADRLYLGDHVGYADSTPPLTVFASGQSLKLRTAHADSYQEIRVDGEPLTLDEANSTMTVGLPVGLVSVNTAKRDVLLETEGYLALKRDHWFAAGPFRIGGLTVEADLDERGIDFILASHLPPERDGGLLSVEADFDLSRLVRRDDGSYRFVVTAPGLAAGTDGPAVESVSFLLNRDGLSWSGLRSRLEGESSGEIRPSPTGRAFEDRPE
jgi:hypothetical protein